MKFRLTIVAFVALALGAGACGELPAESNVVDLRVLGIKSEPAGFLINLDDLGSLTDADLTAQLTALVVDPSGEGMELQLTSAVGCPDYIDTITSASMQMSASGAKICPPPSATSAIPPPIGPLLTTTIIVPPDMPPVVPARRRADDPVGADAFRTACGRTRSRRSSRPRTRIFRRRWNTSISVQPRLRHCPGSST